MPHLTTLSEEQLALHILRTIRSENTVDLHALEKAGINYQTVLQNALGKYESVRKAVNNRSLTIAIDVGGHAGHVYIGFKNDQEKWNGMVFIQYRGLLLVRVECKMRRNPRLMDSPLG